MGCCAAPYSKGLPRDFHTLLTYAVLDRGLPKGRNRRVATGGAYVNRVWKSRVVLAFQCQDDSKNHQISFQASFLRHSAFQVPLKVS